MVLGLMVLCLMVLCLMVLHLIVLDLVVLGLMVLATTIGLLRYLIDLIEMRQMCSVFFILKRTANYEIRVKLLQFYCMQGYNGSVRMSGGVLVV